MFIKFQNSNIHFNSWGSGNPLVVLHGFLGSSKPWIDFTLEFSKHRQIITIDLPGHGKSGCISETHSMELMAEVVFEVLQTLDIKKADFLGHSMGGYVMLALLEAQPQIINSVILLNSTPEADSEVRKINRDRAMTIVKQNKQAYVNMNISNLLTAENKLKFSKELDVLKMEAQQFPEEGILAALKGMKIRKDRTSTLKAFSGKKYMLAGKQDPVVDFEKIEKLSKECGCQLFSFPNGHLSYFEDRKIFWKTMYFIEKGQLLQNV